MCKVSIIVPTLGHRDDELRRLLDSLLVQTDKLFDLILVVQDNQSKVQELVNGYTDKLEIRQINVCFRGLSRARNAAREFINGDIVVYSDDDAWYPATAIKDIKGYFTLYSRCDVLCFQIYDPIIGSLYKAYPSRANLKLSTFQLLSKSSIEIAVRRNRVSDLTMDERFGLGTSLPAAEEADFLVRLKRNGSVVGYVPSVTVFHRKKTSGPKSPERYYATGALFAKHFNFFLCCLACIKRILHRNDVQAYQIVVGYFLFRKKRLTSEQVH